MYQNKLSTVNSLHFNFFFYNLINDMTYKLFNNNNKVG